LWFKHFGDSRRNPKLLRVERKLGEAGYARFFKLLEVVAERGGKGRDFRPEINLNGAATDAEWLASELNIQTHAVRETLDLFAKVGLIDEGAWAQAVVAVPAMTEYKDEYTARRQKRNSSSESQESKSKVETKEKSESESEQNGDSHDNVPISS